MGEQSKSNETENYKTLMSTTTKVLDIMTLGQLLPHPLSSIRDVIPFLKCFEVRIQLNCNFYVNFIMSIRSDCCRFERLCLVLYEGSYTVPGIVQVRHKWDILARS